MYLVGRYLGTFVCYEEYPKGSKAIQVNPREIPLKQGLPGPSLQPHIYIPPYLKLSTVGFPICRLEEVSSSAAPQNFIGRCPVVPGLLFILLFTTELPTHLTAWESPQFTSAKSDYSAANHPLSIHTTSAWFTHLYPPSIRPPRPYPRRSAIGRCDVSVTFSGKDSALPLSSFKAAPPSFLYEKYIDKHNSTSFLFAHRFIDYCKLRAVNRVFLG